MIKRETYSLLSMIEVYYDQFKVDQRKVDLWHEALQNYELEDLKKELVTFVLYSSYPPKVTDLVPKTPVGTNIPNLAETKDIVKKGDQRVCGTDSMASGQYEKRDRNREVRGEWKDSNHIAGKHCIVRKQKKHLSEHSF